MSISELKSNVRLLKGKPNKYAVYGVLIALAVIVIATALISYYQTGDVTLAGMIQAQKTNAVLWLLDALPIFFAIWGQYIGLVLAYEASAIVMEQTSELRPAARNRISHGPRTTGHARCHARSPD